MKLTCDSCGARFYDLNKQPGICPKCGTANARPVIFKASRGRPAEEKVAVQKAPPAAAPGADEVPETEDEEDEDEAVIEDTSDLGEDDEVEVPVEKEEP